MSPILEIEEFAITDVVTTSDGQGGSDTETPVVYNSELFK